MIRDPQAALEILNENWVTIHNALLEEAFKLEGMGHNYEAFDLNSSHQLLGEAERIRSVAKRISLLASEGTPR